MSCGNLDPYSRQFHAVPASHLPDLKLKWLGHVKPSTVLVAAVLAVALIGWADYLTGIELRIFPLYFVPIAMVSWRANSSTGYSVAGLCAVVWLGANWGAGMDSFPALINIVNALVQLIAFVTIAGLVSSYHGVLLEEKLMARTDPLTRLLNKRGLADRAEVEFARSRRSRSSTALALVDLDHFKKVNDTKGHSAGDSILADVGAVLRRRLRRTDIAARVGGDEFVILMADTDELGAASVLGHIRDDIASAAVARDMPVTSSIGACVFQRIPADLDEMLRRADQLMYEAKHAGGNRITLKTVDQPPVFAQP